MNGFPFDRNILKGYGDMYVKQRAGHLSYKDDPKGYHSVLAQSLTQDQSLGKVVKVGSSTVYRTF